MRLTRRPSDSADLVQEALCRAWANWTRFERGGSVGAYLARILVNAFISRHRHARVVAAVHARGEIADHLFDEPQRALAGSPEHDIDEGQLSDEVLAALQTLPQHYREVVELVDVGGMPYKDAAARLDIPLGTVMSRLHRARRIMREALREYARERGLSPQLRAAA
jgi:RNA polymerase sigma-70 factor (ECF subfamily)